ncbi:hypothetical protein [Treponema zioleckii]|uniref:hypothetical protein n=1 Tax=Treponema zioleckii TaxID=331680 RepID=UPI00168A734F|nr:hypothetical protein [Treponema zioleckii]
MKKNGRKFILKRQKFGYEKSVFSAIAGRARRNGLSRTRPPGQARLPEKTCGAKSRAGQACLFFSAKEREEKYIFKMRCKFLFEVVK